MSPTAADADLAALTARAVAARNGLIATMLAHRRDDELFPAKPDDTSTTLSVSAMVALALHEARHPDAARALHGVLQGPRQGAAYSSQDRSHTHILATAWPVLTCTSIDPFSVVRLAGPAQWLTEQGKYGAYSYSPRQPVRPFYSGVVLLALSFYKLAADRAVPQSPTLTSLLAEHIVPNLQVIGDWIVRNRLPNSEPWQWPASGGEPSPCLVSTTAAYAGLRAAIAADDSCDFGFRRHVDAIQEELLAGLAAAVDEAGNRNSGWADLWPWITETAPSYWYRFFTPVLALVATDTASTRWVRRNEVLAAVTWMVSNCERENGELWVRPKPGRMELTLWTAANAVVVLSRFIDGVGESLIMEGANRDGANIAGQSASDAAAVLVPLTEMAETLSHHYSDRSSVRTLLNDAGIPVEEALVEGTGRVIWDHLVDWLHDRTEDDLALRAAVVRDKPMLVDSLVRRNRR